MELLDALCCPVSQEPYGATGAVRPRILPCGHTISHTALQSVRHPHSFHTHPLHLLTRLASAALLTLASAKHTSRRALPRTPTLPSHQLQSPLSSPAHMRATPAKSQVIQSCVACLSAFVPGSTILSNQPDRTKSNHHLVIVQDLPTHCAPHLQILRQDSSASHVCPICRARLPSTSARTYATNFAILDILPGIFRMRTGAAADTHPYATGDLNSSDSGSDAGGATATFSHGADSAAVPAPTPSTAAVAALFPRVAWLQERAELPLRLSDLLPALQEGVSLHPRTVGHLTAKYEMAPAAVTLLSRSMRSSPGSSAAHDANICLGASAPPPSSCPPSECQALSPACTAA